MGMPHRMAADAGRQESDHPQVESLEHDGRSQNTAHLIRRSVRLSQRSRGTVDENHQGQTAGTDAGGTAVTLREGACF
mgnify:CR=1 FL=1